MPDPGESITMDTLRGWHTPRILASLLAGMPMGVLRPRALPREGQPFLGSGKRAFYVGGRDWPLLSDVAIASHLGLPGPLPEELRLALDRIGEGSLTLFRRLASVARSVRNVIDRTVRGAQSPAVAPALFPLAGMGDAVRSELIQALLAHLDPDRGEDEPHADARRPAAFVLEMYAAVGRAVANPTSGVPYPVGSVLRPQGANRTAALIAAVGPVAAATPGLFLLDTPQVLGLAATDGTLEPFLSGDGDEDLLDRAGMTVLAQDVDALRVLIGGLMEELSALRLDARGGVARLGERIARLEIRAPGEEPLATVGDVDAYRTSAAHGMGVEMEARVAWCERNLSALAQVVANPRAAVGLQNALAQRTRQQGQTPEPGPSRDADA